MDWGNPWVESQNSWAKGISGVFPHSGAGQNCSGPCWQSPHGQTSRSLSSPLFATQLQPLWRLLLGQTGHSLSSYTMCTWIALPPSSFLLYPALLCHSLAKSKEGWRAPELHCWGSRRALTGGSGTCRAGTCKAVPPLAHPRAVLKGLMLSSVKCPLWNPFKLLCSSVGCIQTKSCRAFHES